MYILLYYTSTTHHPTPSPEIASHSKQEKEERDLSISITSQDSRYPPPQPGFAVGGF
jgi:hypothetical protein